MGQLECCQLGASLDSLACVSNALDTLQPCQRGRVKSDGLSALSQLAQAWLDRYSTSKRPMLVARPLCVLIHKATTPNFKLQPPRTTTTELNANLSRYSSVLGYIASFFVTFCLFSRRFVVRPSSRYQNGRVTAKRLPLHPEVGFWSRSCPSPSCPPDDLRLYYQAHPS